MAKRFTRLPLFPLLIVLLAVATSANGQTHYLPCQEFGFQIITETEFSARHSEALAVSNLESYRLRDANRLLKFEDGIEFELLSAMELISRGCSIQLDSYLSQNEINQSIWLVFELASENRISVRSEIDPKSKLAKLGTGPVREPRIYIEPQTFELMSLEKQQMIRDNPQLYRMK